MEDVHIRTSMEQGAGNHMRGRARKALVAVAAASLVAVPVLTGAGTAWAVAGAAFTTNNPNEDGLGTCLNGNSDPNPSVNCNLYNAKSDVWINGGPSNGNNALTPGTYFFAVLEPGGQNDSVNDGGPQNLSDTDPAGGINDSVGDAYTNREFTVAESGKIDNNLGTHDEDDFYADPNGLFIRLAPYDTTSNPGGVYILAICQLSTTQAHHYITGTVDPSLCKYDAFKVKDSGGEPQSDLIAIKDATPSYTRTFTWGIDKSVDKTTVFASGGSATFNYTVVATKSAAVDSNFQVAGTVTVFNPNVGSVSGVAVTDAIGADNCVVTGGSASIPGGDNAVFDYVCSLPAANATTSGTNTANITWDQTSINSPTGATTATAAFDFATASPTVVGDSANVTDLFNGGVPVALTPATITATHTYTYPRTIQFPATGCVTYPNTATVTYTGGSASDSASVTLCKLNSNGYTMGFWKNNSDKVIKTAGDATTYCAAIAQYPNVLTAPVPCNKTSLLNYIKSTLTAAEASGDGAPMFKGQFLASLLSVTRTPSLGTTNITLSSAESILLNATGCESVSSVLSKANTAYPTLSNPALTAKAAFMSIKDIFDRVNNNNQLTC
jgi:hypothetical protein